MPLEYKILPIFDFSTTRKQELKIDKVSYTHTHATATKCENVMRIQISWFGDSKTRYLQHEKVDALTLEEGQQDRICTHLLEEIVRLASFRLRVSGNPRM